MFGCSNSQLIILLLVFQLTKSALGACENYGHSCWGGHGKRSISGIQTDHDVKDAQLSSSHTAPSRDNQWGLQDLPDIHMMDNESRLSAKEQKNDEVPGDLLFTADDNIGLPHKLARRRILNLPKRMLEKMKIL